MADKEKLLSHFYVKLSGQNAPDDFLRDMLNVSIESSLHLPDVATLALHDARLKWIDHESLLPGKTLEIAAKLGTSEQTIFDGEIIEIEPEFAADTHRLMVRAFDRLHRLARGRHVRTFLNITDGDLAQKLAAEVGLAAQVGPTPEVHPFVFQTNQTNLGFLQGRAAALGFLLFVRGKTLHFEPPKPSGGANEVQWGQTLSEFRPHMTTVQQLTGVTARGWDIKEKREIIGKAQQDGVAPEIGESRSGGALAQEAFRLNATTLVADRPIRTQTMADKIAQATADQHGGGFVEAEGTCGGTPTISAGSPLKISNVGDRFSGTYFVTSATHNYSAEQGYATHFNVSALQPSTFLSLMPQEASSPVPPGVVIGIVTDNNDPDNLGRIKVKYPWFSNDHASDWARIVSIGGGPKRGMQFIPEINDEVLIGFELGDMHHPYIIGGLWNGKDKPPLPTSKVVSGSNVINRVVYSRKGHHLDFFDDVGPPGHILIETWKEQLSVKLDDTEKLIRIKTRQHTVTINDQSNNITVDCGGDLTITAAGQISITGVAGVNIQGAIVKIN
ncbi:MAG: VgrG-related protein [Roseiflexaceae bacterium]|nr:VgrG-related protein [Roseiflexaceae bacterium]